MSKVQGSATCDTCGTKNCTCSNALAKELKEKARCSDENPVTKCSNKHKMPKTSCNRCGKPKKDASFSASELYLWDKREKNYECPPMPVVDCADCRPAWLCDPYPSTPPFQVPEGVCIQPISFKGPDPGCPNDNECNSQSAEEAAADTVETPPEENCEEELVAEVEEECEVEEEVEEECEVEEEVEEECEVEEEVLECEMEEDDCEVEDDDCEVEIDECDDDEADVDDDDDEC